MNLLADIKSSTKNPLIEVIGLRYHGKASESYVDACFTYEGGASWNGLIPYEYRRTGLFLDDPKLIAEMLDLAYEDIEPNRAKQWAAKEAKWWNESNSGKNVTKGFFFKLLNLEWNCVEHDLPPNPNWARRVQDIKEMGYTLSTDTRHKCKHTGKNSTHIILLPFDRSAPTGYEFISPKLKERIIKLLNSYDAFESTKRPSRNLIPDHKFPEISWDAETKNDNLDDLTDEEIKAKFQLLDNQRNLQKRESNRETFQSGKRGTIFGIKFYFKGDENWPKGVPRIGQEAEEGWVGSPWYDIEKWRVELNKKLETVRHLELLLGHSLEEELKKLKRDSS